MFWNAECMKRLYPFACVYPQLYARSIGNVHGTSTVPGLIKVNLYTTLSDRIQAEFAPTPIRFLNIAGKISKNSQSFIESRAFTRNNTKYMNQLLRNIEKCESNLNLLIGGDTGCRAEYRVTFSNISSMFEIKRRLLAPSRIHRYVRVIETDLIIQLAGNYINILKAPIINNINLINHLYVGAEEDPIARFGLLIVSLTVFESLLCCSLFTGRTLSYASYLVWKKRTEEEFSLSLTDSIQRLNRLCIKEESFLESTRILNFPNFQLAFDKICGTDRGAFADLLNLNRAMTRSNGTELEKAICLWKCYFAQLTSDHFGDGPRWKLASAIPGRMVFKTGVTFENAIIGIFDSRRLLAKSSAWKKPFLIGYSDIIRRSTPAKTEEAQQAFRLVLLEAAKTLEIELVHYFTDNCELLYGGGRMYRKVYANLAEVRNDGPVHTTDNVLEVDELLIESNVLVPSGTPYSYEEERDIVDGYNKHRESVAVWADILKDREFCFFQNPRTNTSLKDKFKNLKKYKKISQNDDGIYVFTSEEGPLTPVSNRPSSGPCSRSSSSTASETTLSRIDRVSFPNNGRTQTISHLFNTPNTNQGSQLPQSPTQRTVLSPQNLVLELPPVYNVSPTLGGPSIFNPTSPRNLFPTSYLPRPSIQSEIEYDEHPPAYDTLDFSTNIRNRGRNNSFDSVVIVERPSSTFVGRTRAINSPRPETARPRQPWNLDDLSSPVNPNTGIPLSFISLVSSSGDEFLNSGIVEVFGSDDDQFSDHSDVEDSNENIITPIFPYVAPELNTITNENRSDEEFYDALGTSSETSSQSDLESEVDETVVIFPNVSSVASPYESDYSEFESEEDDEKAVASPNMSIDGQRSEDRRNFTDEEIKERLIDFIDSVIDNMTASAYIARRLIEYPPSAPLNWQPLRIKISYANRPDSEQFKNLKEILVAVGILIETSDGLIVSLNMNDL